MKLVITIHLETLSLAFYKVMSCTVMINFTNLQPQGKNIIRPLGVGLGLGGGGPIPPPEPPTGTPTTPEDYEEDYEDDSEDDIRK